jgi:hypothetical protein
MDIVRAFLGFVLVAGVSACGGESTEANVGGSPAMGGGFGGASAGSVADASMGSTGGTANGGAAGNSSSAADAHGSSGAGVADVTTVSQGDAKADVVTDVRGSSDGPACPKDPGTCDCIAQCYLSSDCPEGRTCQCQMGPCFCHRCGP